MILKTGTKKHSVFEIVEEILHECDYDSKGICGLCNASFDRLVAIEGLGPSKASQLLSAIEIGKRIRNSSVDRKLTFSSPCDVASYYMEQLRHLSREQVIIVYLDARLQYIGDEILSIGTINSSLLSQREVFSLCLRKNCVSFILLHNHPSGDPSPGKDDILSTRKILEGAKTLGLCLKDHIIIGDNRYYSFSEQGMI